MKKIKQLPTLREKSLLDENLADFSFCDIMSVSEREQAMLVHRERRMAIMIAAYAASSTKGANHDIMSAREPEGACSLLANGECRWGCKISP